MPIRVTEAEAAALVHRERRRAGVRRGENAESALQRAIADALGYAGCWVVRLNAGAIQAEGGRLVRLAPAFPPDLLVVLPGGRVVFLEVKTPTGRLTAAQQRVHAALAELGATVVVVRSVEEVHHWAVAEGGEAAWLVGRIEP